MNVWYWLARPRMLKARVTYWLWERRNPDKPWLTPSAVQYCEDTLTRSMRGWEFGSGRSTAWYAAHLGHLVSVEHHSGWHAKVKSELDRKGLKNVEYRLIALDHPESEPERPAYDPLPKYVAALAQEPDGSVDFVVVDGHYRTACVRAALAKVRPSGLLLVDDINIMWPNRESLPVPAAWPLVHQSTNGIKSTWVWQRPS